MRTRLQGHGTGGRRSRWIVVLPAVGAVLLGSCLGEPDVDERWWHIGIRIEDDALVTPEGCELLTRDVPVQPDEIEALMRG